MHKGHNESNKPIIGYYPLNEFPMSKASGMSGILPEHEHFMNKALLIAKQALAEGEVPVGAIVVYQGQVIAQSGNQLIRDSDPTAHAEVVALRQAAVHLGNCRIPGTRLYTTLEPCVMCYSAMVYARIDHLVYGASDPKSGAAGGGIALQDTTLFNHSFIITPGVLGEACSQLLDDFFASKRHKADSSVKR